MQFVPVLRDVTCPADLIDPAGRPVYYVTTTTTTTTTATTATTNTTFLIAAGGVPRGPQRPGQHAHIGPAAAQGEGADRRGYARCGPANMPGAHKRIYRAQVSEHACKGC